ncbi:MAG: thioesterase family protein [Betaproteobacteria bacterium]
MTDILLVPRSTYRHFVAIPTRWMDNDNYGHVNNVTYYSYFDTAVNAHLIHAGGLDPVRDTVVGYVVETACRFHRPLSFPQEIDAGLAVTRIGTSAITYAIGLFAANTDQPAASGHFVHVWVDRTTQRPAPIPTRIRAAVGALLIPLV